MNKTLVTLVLVFIASFAFAQNEVILIDEDFNTPIIGAGDYEYNSTNCTASFELENTSDNTPALKLPVCSSSGSHRIIFNAVSTTPYDSIKVSFDYKCNTPSPASYGLKLESSADSIDWYQVGYTTALSQWSTYEYVMSWQSDSPIYFRVSKSYNNASYNTTGYLDNFQIIGYTSEPPVVDPVPCDTVFVEVPIILYETDIPQECMLDGNGDGMIGLFDLLHLLTYYGGWSPCDVVN